MCSFTSHIGSKAPEESPTFLIEMASKQSKQNLGVPYQIYSEVANAGKNLASTKRRVTWRFGWSEGEGDHEVTLVHSVVSGKKVHKIV